MHLYFIGGGNHVSEEFEGILSHLKRHVTPSHKILLIPFATEPSKIPGWYDTVKQAFELVGNHKVDVLYDDMPAKAMAEKINQHDILYFTGGRPERLVEQLSTHHLIPVLQQFSGVMIGYSAGALAFCKDCIISKDKDYPQTIILKGLDLVDFSVEVHYEDTVDEELLPLSKNREIYALPNGSALCWRNGELEFIHDIYYFHDSQKVKLA
ncbi:Type 1 glutamine amidotransferase-like domain-containing protein [Sporosarcina sp. Te-1]|uniref:Type 1 glutamine amidotransferase-like domain-containing protein n=1 Tax=Sporosarcina sp. Te-1 TaxID=2818390 RepID=UPI001A9CC346|nr:Type 1 glutamine amidotransferase-like domain-containing protein [Sporosarcina sp. Te-1]QTD40922.1 Type 1 glutamine amidotransferase-like domain-containing protein [Sporosarcina sp. Te-1]